MRNLSKMLVVANCLWAGFVIGQDKPKDAMMSKAAMQAKKKIMAPETMAAAKKSMMSKDSMVPAMVAKEMVQQDVMHDKEAMGMVEKATMTKTSDDKMLADEKVTMASDKMMSEPTAMQMLFQELVARHIAAKKMAMMKKADPKMMTPAGKEMKSMMMDEKAMMGTKEEMMTNENTAAMMAREELIHSLMLDKEVMAIVEKESMMHEDPKMAPMMSDEKMKMEGEMMVQDQGKAKGMMQDTMIRKMIDGKHKMMKESATSKK